MSTVPLKLDKRHRRRANSYGRGSEDEHTAARTERAQRRAHQQMGVMGSQAPDVTEELLLNIACQNKFMSFKGLSLHHKSHYEAPLFSWKDETPDLKPQKGGRRW